MIGIVIALVLFLAVVAFYGFVLCRRFLTLFGIERSKKKSKIISIIFAIACFVGCLWVFGISAVFILYFLGASLIVNLVLDLLDKLIHNVIVKKWLKRIQYSCVAGLLITGLLITYGYYNMYNVVKTEYHLTTKKTLSKELTIAQISDLHAGTTFSAATLEKYCGEIQSEQPDLLLLTGDIVDESTTKEEMEQYISVLASVKTTYGIYYVFGNHDYNSYTRTPYYSTDVLHSTLENKGIHVMEDSTVDVNDEIVLIGRKDASQTSEPVSSLLTTNMKNKLVILLDHQPKNIEESAESGVDLQFSGHTHAGQIWPTGQLGQLFHVMEWRYGLKQIGDYQLIVSSGIAGWGYPIRTSEHCEYVITKVTQEKNVSVGEKQ